jgi:hypothetical protein
VSELLDAGYGLDALDMLPDREEIGSYRASSIRTRAVTWAWTDYFPLGKLSIVEGDPGDGKSILTIDLAARWSTGAPMPDGTNGIGPWPVIMVSAEDDLDDTIVPRLIAAGARLEDIHLISHGLRPEDPFDFATGLASVERLALEVGARSIIFDPLMAFLGEKTDSHNDASVRRALQPLKALAFRTGAAVLAVRHLNKGGTGAKAIYRGGGSIAFTGAARATFLVVPDHKDPHIKILASVKSNLSRRPPSLRYEVAVSELGVPYLIWRGTAEVNAQQALDGPEADRSDDEEEKLHKRRARALEIEFLADLLEDRAMYWLDIVAAGKVEGFTEISLRRARIDAGLRKIPGERGGNSTQWTLAHPAHRAHGLGVQSASLIGEHDEQGPSPAAPSTTDSDRESIFDAAPLLCDVCGGVDGVARYAEPWFVVRCANHNPISYAGEAP